MAIDLRTREGLSHMVIFEAILRPMCAAPSTVDERSTK
jgi:hypothetical protein